MTQQPWGNQQHNPWGPPQGSQWGPPQGNQWPPPQASTWGQPAPVPPQQQGWQRPNYQYPTGMPPYPGQAYGRPPKRRRNPLVTFLKALFLLAVLGFLALTLLGFLLSYVADHEPAPQPTSVSTQDAPTDEPTAGPTGQASSEPQGSVPPAAYQNEDYQVPPVDRTPPGLPQPETYPEATSLLKANPLYANDVPRPVRCEMRSINMSDASREELTTHLNDMMGCLMRVWEEPLTKAGFTPVRPSVTVYSGAVTTKCGKLPAANAVYCGADQQVYYAEDLPRVVPRSLRDSRFITESVVAHEFGHAVQARSAILVSELAWEEKSDKSTALELSRRLEVQADCFAGQFLGSIQTSTRMSDEELDNVTKLFHSIGDDVLTGKANYVGNHGSGASRMLWTNAGLKSSSVGACNTFSAPSSKVR